MAYYLDMMNRGVILVDPACKSGQLYVHTKAGNTYLRCIECGAAWDIKISCIFAPAVRRTVEVST